MILLNNKIINIISCFLLILKIYINHVVLINLIFFKI